MALSAIEHPLTAHLLADAVDLLRAAARPGSTPPDDVARRCLRPLVDDLRVAVGELEEALAVRTGPLPVPLAVAAPVDPGGARTGRPGSLRLRTTGDEVRLAGRGPTAEGDLVRAALHRRAGASGTVAQERLGGLLWEALVAMSVDGLEPATAVPSPLGLVGRT